MKKRDDSSLRKECDDLRRRISQLVEVFCARSPLWQGTVYLLRTRCGRANCHCVKGTLHETVVLADRSQKPYRTLALRPREVAKLRRLTEAYRRVRKGRTQLVAIHKAMLEIVDGLTESRLEEGRRRAPARLVRQEPKKGG
jgi:hypothetical protein